MSAEERSDWLERSVLSRRRNEWWNPYRNFISKEFRQFLSLEPRAAVLRNYEPFLVPGLLQTHQYARAVLETLNPEGDPEGDGEVDVGAAHSVSWRARIDSLVELRMERRRRLWDRDPPVRAHFVLDEAALRRRVGTPDVMRGQLRSLKDDADLHNVQIHVIRFEQGLLEHWSESYVLMELPLVIVGPILFRESPHDDNIVRETVNEREPAMYLSSFFALQELAPAERTVDVIDALLDSYDE